MPPEDSPAGLADPAGKRNIYALGAVSFFTDLSTEMIYPLLPDLLRSLGAGSVVLGLVEGVAEATASITKVFSGVISDRIGRRKLPVLAGYSVSAVAKPLLALAGSWPLILAVRFLDRVGKGIRTPPRDALLADSSPPGMTGKSFGLHRAMDTFGAVAGPVVAYLLLGYFSLELKPLFLVAFIPGAVAVAVIITLVREKAPRTPPGPRPPITLKGAHPAFRRFVIVSAVFSLGSFPVAFLILRCRELGVSLVHVPLVYLVFNVVYSLVALPAGALSDRIGRRRTLIAAYFIFAAVFGLGALARTEVHIIGVFMAFGIFMGVYDGAQRAFCADLEPSSRRASSYGVLHAVTGLFALPAAGLAGLLWKYPGAPWAFATAAVAGLASALLMILLIPRRIID